MTQMQEGSVNLGSSMVQEHEKNVLFIQEELQTGFSTVCQSRCLSQNLFCALPMWYFLIIAEEHALARDN